MAERRNTISYTLDEAVDFTRVFLDRSLLELDFDGTLSELVTDPQTSKLAPGAHDALSLLSEQGAQIAIVTGRDAATVVRLAELESIPNVLVKGLYGLESWQNGELTTIRTPDSMLRLQDELPAVLDTPDADKNLWIENKRLSLVIHARPCVEPDAALSAIRPQVDAIAKDLNLETHPGNMVLELRLPGYDKGGALHVLYRQFRPEVTIAAGDDIGDIAAFKIIKTIRGFGEFAWSMAALSPETPPEVRAQADFDVLGPTAIVDVLHRLARKHVI